MALTASATNAVENNGKIILWSAVISMMMMMMMTQVIGARTMPLQNPTMPRSTNSPGELHPARAT